MSFSFFVLGRKNMTFVPLVAFDLAAPGDAKPFGCGSIGPDFWHCVGSFENDASKIVA